MPPVEMCGVQFIAGSVKRRFAFVLHHRFSLAHGTTLAKVSASRGPAPPALAVSRARSARCFACVPILPFL